MGSWTELDANYPPDALTPATALVVALGHLRGAYEVLERDGLTDVLPSQLGRSPDLVRRARHYLAEVPLEAFLAEARALLSTQQQLVLSLQVLDVHLAHGAAPTQRARLDQLLAGILADPGALEPHRATLALKNELRIFPQ
jgi:hypothetical protein